MSTTASTLTIITVVLPIVFVLVAAMLWQRVMILRALQLPLTWHNLLIGPSRDSS